MIDQYRNRRIPVENLAKKHGYTPMEMNETQIKQGMVSLVKDTEKWGEVRINYWLSTRRMSICLNHPKQGRNTQYKGYTDLRVLEQLLINPRSHTDAGYRSRKNKNRSKKTNIK